MRKWLMLAVLAIASVANGATVTEKIDRTVDVRPGTQFALTNVNGSVTLQSWDQPRVRVIAEKRVKAGSDADAAAVMKRLRVDISSRPDGVTVKTVHPQKNGDGWGLFDWLTGDSFDASVKYEIFVPRTMNLDLETVNGAIHAELRQVTRNADIMLSTTNGRIVLQVPQTLAADVDIDTLNGSIETDLPVATTSVSRNSLRGKINGGGSDLRLSTTNGSVEIRTIKAVAAK